jgi:hypothetical protein
MIGRPRAVFSFHKNGGMPVKNARKRANIGFFNEK